VCSSDLGGVGRRDVARAGLTTGAGKNEDKREHVHGDNGSEDLEDFHGDI
jgi:hypothetical protein